MKIGVSVAGEKELVKALSALPGAMQKKTLRAVLMEAGAPVRSRIAQGTPRSDEAPHIADNIVMNPVSKVDGVRLREDEAAVAIGPARGTPSGKRFKGFFYGWFMEYGTVKHAPQPFMRPAWDAMKARTQSAIVDGLKRALRSRSSSGRGL